MCDGRELGVFRRNQHYAASSRATFHFVAVGSSQRMEDCIELHNALLSTRSVEGFLHELAQIAARQVAEGLSCALTMQPRGRPVTVACTDPVAAQVDEMQYRLEDGPCLHAMRDGQVVSIEDTADEARWPEFETQAAAAGIRSCLAVPLKAPVPGAVILYARTASAFGETETQRAEGFAERASGALAVAERIAFYADLNEQLRASLISRSVIDQALGIIMVRENCTQSRAFAILRAASQNTNTKLRDLAADIVTSVTGEPVQSSSFEDPSDPTASATLG
jgi:GAF domain-containing protein